MTEGSPRQPENTSFPLLRNFGDPVIENLGNLPPVHEIGLAPPAGVLAREPSVGGERYFVFAREVTDYRELPITVGMYFSSARSMVRSGCSIGRQSLRSDCWGCH